MAHRNASPGPPFPPLPLGLPTPHPLVSPARPRVIDTVSAPAVAERPHFNTTRACEQQREGNSGSPYGIVYRCRGRRVALAQRRECRAPIWRTLTCAGRSFLHGSHCDGPNLARSHQHGHSGRVVRTPPPLVRGAERHEDRAKAPRRCEVVYEGDVDPRLWHAIGRGYKRKPHQPVHHHAGLLCNDTAPECGDHSINVEQERVLRRAVQLRASAVCGVGHEAQDGGERARLHGIRRCPRRWRGQRSDGQAEVRWQLRQEKSMERRLTHQPAMGPSAHRAAHPRMAGRQDCDGTKRDGGEAGIQGFSTRVVGVQGVPP